MVRGKNDPLGDLRELLLKRWSGSTMPRELRTLGMSGRGDTTGPRDFGERSAFRVLWFDRRVPVVTESRTARVLREGAWGRTTRGAALRPRFGVAVRAGGVRRVIFEGRELRREKLDRDGAVTVGREIREDARPARDRLMRAGLRE